MLTDEAKRWLIKYAGRNNCFAPDGVTFKDPDGVEHTGSTGDVLNALYVAQLLGGSYTDQEIIAGKSYKDFIRETGMRPIEEDGVLKPPIEEGDVRWVYYRCDPNNLYCIREEQPPEQPLEEGKGTVVVKAFDKATNEEIYAQLVVDGVKNNVTPETLTLDAGDHIITALAKGYKPARDVVTVRSGKTSYINLYLEKLKPVEVRVTAEGEELPGAWVVDVDIPPVMTIGEVVELAATVYSNDDIDLAHVDFEFYRKDTLEQGGWNGSIDDLQRFAPEKTYWTKKGRIPAGEETTLVGTPTIRLSEGDYIVVYKFYKDR